MLVCIKLQSSHSNQTTHPFYGNDKTIENLVVLRGRTRLRFWKRPGRKRHQFGRGGESESWRFLGGRHARRLGGHRGVEQRCCSQPGQKFGRGLELGANSDFIPTS